MAYLTRTQNNANVSPRIDVLASTEDRGRHFVVSSRHPDAPDHEPASYAIHLDGGINDYELRMNTAEARQVAEHFTRETATGPGAAPTLAIPSIHMNGTAKATLLAEARLDIETMQDAIEKLQSHAPHARDYYVQGEGAFTLAAVQHAFRIVRLRAVLRELETLAESIDAGGFQAT